MTTKHLLEELAKKLRSRSKWCVPGYYSDDLETAVLNAKGAVYDDIASDLEELALVADE